MGGRRRGRHAVRGRHPVRGREGAWFPARSRHHGHPRVVRTGLQQAGRRLHRAGGSARGVDTGEHAVLGERQPEGYELLDAHHPLLLPHDVRGRLPGRLLAHPGRHRVGGVVTLIGLQGTLHVGRDLDAAAHAEPSGLQPLGPLQLHLQRANERVVLLLGVLAELLHQLLTEHDQARALHLVIARVQLDDEAVGHDDAVAVPDPGIDVALAFERADVLHGLDRGLEHFGERPVHHGLEAAFYFVQRPHYGLRGDDPP